jgi:hypothetical protein
MNRDQQLQQIKDEFAAAVSAHPGLQDALFLHYFERWLSVRAPWPEGFEQPPRFPDPRPSARVLPFERTPDEQA